MMSAVKFDLDSPSGTDAIADVQPEVERLCQGDNLSSDEFLRIWENLPNVKYAELIDGVVYMPSPIGPKHGSMHLNLSGWLANFCFATTGIEGGTNGTWLMLESVPQPDVALWLRPEYGGAVRVERGFPSGAPELAAEVASSSVAYDLHQKLNLYRAAGVQEYLVVVVRKPAIHWFRRVDKKYESLNPDDAGVIRSQVFPGLWLNSVALLKDDMNAVMATLQEGLRSPEHADFVARLKETAAKQPPAS
jgi:Uma2 family endonuclease